MNLLNADWHILPSAAIPLALSFARAQSQSQSQDRTPELKAAMPNRPACDCNGDPFPKMEMRNDIAIIPVSGPIAKGATGSDKYWMGVTSYEDILADVEMAIQQDARGLIFNMASPGGTVVGLSEAAAHIADVASHIPTASFNGHMCCSAAEYLTASVGMRFASPSSYNGSIGTIMEMVSYEKMLERFGITVELITSGKYKATGHPAKDLTDDQIDMLKAFVQQRAADFKDWMVQHRPRIAAEEMQGQWFDGKHAFAAGFVDGTAASIETVLQLMP